MVDSDDAAVPTRRTRAPGAQYPGASLAEVLTLLGYLEDNGDKSTVGRLAVKVGKSENSALFKRLIISARAYGLAEWENDAKNVLVLTAEGKAAVVAATAEDALRKAFVRPEVFREVARQFAGRRLPEVNEFADTFRIAGVAPSGSELAAANFVASAEAAGAVEDEGGRKLLMADLPFPSPDASTATRPQTGSRTRGSGAAAGTSSAARRPTPPRDPMPDPQPLPSGGLAVELKIDVSGWEVAKVMELVRELRKA